jgi:hypothetical protein
VQGLLEINPWAIEYFVGQFCAIFLFNIDHVDVTEFWKNLLQTFVKLRQIPKLIAKLLIAVSKNEDLKVIRLSENITDPFAKIVESLPIAQVLELWKTFLFHLKLVVETPGVISDHIKTLINSLMATFFKHVCIMHYSLPKSMLDKVCDLMKSTNDDILEKMGPEEFLEVRVQYVELYVALNHFR